MCRMMCFGGKVSCRAYRPACLWALPPSLTQMSSVQIADYVLSVSVQEAENTVSNLAEKKRLLPRDFTLKETQVNTRAITIQNLRMRWWQALQSKAHLGGAMRGGGGAQVRLGWLGIQGKLYSSPWFTTGTLMRSLDLLEWSTGHWVFS